MNYKNLIAAIVTLLLNSSLLWAFQKSSNQWVFFHNKRNQEQTNISLNMMSFDNQKAEKKERASPEKDGIKPVLKPQDTKKKKRNNNKITKEDRVKKLEKKKVFHKIKTHKTPKQTQQGASASKKALVKHKAKLIGQYLPPQYPQNALENGIEGSVTIKATIDKVGKVISVKVLKSSNNKSLDNAAIKWFLNLKFTPAKTGKTPEKSVIIQKIKFNIKD